MPPSQHTAHVDRQRRALPDAPGVYLFHDEHDNVLYVGKATSLKKRVGSYFSKSHDGKTHALVMRIANIEVFELSSEREALVFEQKLINRYKPPFNVMMRDDKSYPYIAVTVGDSFPRVLFTRSRNRPGTRYFGPYLNARRVRETLDLLNRIFPYRPCEGPEPGRQSGTPCLDFHIERCAAPCISNISREDYRAVIQDVMHVLAGKAGPVQRRLTEQMQAASAELEFERAAKLRNRLMDLERVLELQQAEAPGRGSFDVVGAAVGPISANVQVLQVRDGVMFDRKSWFLDNVTGLDAGTVLAQFLLEYYAPGRPIPTAVVVADSVLTELDRKMVEEELGRLRGARVEVRAAQRGDKRRLAQLAQKNAHNALEYDSIKERTRLERREAALEGLRDELGLEGLPLRIECYDISNLQDEAPVASMVVFEDGRPAKPHYRKFAMRHPDGQDDFAMMHEVITRRFARLACPDADDPDDSFDSIPNLVVIDGGLGQLGAAVEALRASGVPRVAICSLAKREELVYLPGSSSPVTLDRTSPALHLLQRIRDEAHRFALGYHRTRRDSHRYTSVLDQLDGVGEARRRALLTFFGSPERVLEATLDEIEAVPGIPGKVARRIHEQIHRLGGNSGAVTGSG
jgi:excinuclease ABC subunit C